MHSSFKSKAHFESDRKTRRADRERSALRKDLASMKETKTRSQNYYAHRLAERGRALEERAHHVCIFSDSDYSFWKSARWHCHAPQHLIQMLLFKCHLCFAIPPISCYKQRLDSESPMVHTNSYLMITIIKKVVGNKGRTGNIIWRLKHFKILHALSSQFPSTGLNLKQVFSAAHWLD